MADLEEQLPSEFILELFRLALHDQYVQQICVSKIQTNWLQEQVERDFLTTLKYQVQVENRKPSFGTMLLAAKIDKNKTLLEYLAVLRELKLPDVSTVLKGIETFVKQAMYVEMYDRSSTEYNRGNRSKAYALFLKGAEQLSAFSLATDLFEPVFKSFGVRNASRIIENSMGYDYMPFGIDGIDALFGGFQRKEYVLFMAGSKGTKSFAMNHAGVNYARRGYGVAHIQIEGTKKQCMSRYDSNWLGSSYNEIRAGEITEQKFKAHRKIIDNIGKGEIYVYAPERYQAMTMLDIRRMIIDLQKKFKIDVVIIDYLDLVPPDGEKYTVHDERLKKQRTSRAMKDLAMETDTLVISNTQASSVSSEQLNDTDFVLKRENTSEDKGTVQAVDYLITINRTKDEREAKIARLYVDAAREHAADQVITIVQNLAHARFYDRRATINKGFFNTT